MELSYEWHQLMLLIFKLLLVLPGGNGYRSIMHFHKWQLQAPEDFSLFHVGCQIFFCNNQGIVLFHYDYDDCDD